MPLLDLRTLDDGSRMGIWRMTENEEDLRLRFPQVGPEIEGFKSAARRLERLCVTALICEMTRHPDLVVHHNASGKPLIDGSSLSISHTRGYCAAIYNDNPNHRLGIDIEQTGDRVRRIKKMFVRPDEDAVSTLDLLCLWSAKETCYKYYSEDDLQYFEMRGRRVGDNLIEVENLKRKEALRVGWEAMDDYVLTYSLPIL